MHHSAIPVLRVRYLKAFCRALDERGFEYEQMLQLSGLNLTLLETPEAWMPLSQLAGFIDTAVSETGYVTLGLDAGIAPRQQHSEFSKLVLYSPTLYQSLQAVCNNAASEDTSAEFRVVRDGAYGWLHCGAINASPEAIRQIETYRYAALLEIIRLAAGPDYLPSLLFLQGCDHEAFRTSPLLRDVDVRFSRPGLAIAFEPELFSRPVINVPDLPTTKPEFSNAPVEFGQALLEITRTQLLSGHPEIEHAAAALGLSVRTLQRRLYEQELSYARLLQHVRIDTAKNMLEKGSAPIADISTNLGYRHSTHFTRAFRQVCGLTPREYRRLNSARGESLRQGIR
jgi:AraC-like DNA-binding protein